MDHEAARESTHSFAWFSSLPAYREMNLSQLEAFLAEVEAPTPWRGVDVACGPGLMSELCHEIAQRQGATIERMVCVDVDEEALRIARTKLAGRRAGVLQSQGQRLPLRGGTASFVTIGNGIHNFDDAGRTALLAEAFRVLRPRGRLFFNSGFYEGAVVEGTEGYWRENVRGALRSIVRSGPRGREEGDTKPAAIHMLTADDYVGLTRAAGFGAVRLGQTELRFDRELMEAICDYGLYAQGALHFRYPAEVACAAMREAARALFDDPEWERKYPGLVEDGRRYIPRRVLWVAAEKPGS
jgi:SAM-dependent methyltransferase